MTPKAHAFILVVLFSSPDFVHSARFHLPFQLVELESALRIRITARFLQSLSFPRDPRLRPATEHRWGTEPPRRSRGPITGVKAPRTVPTAFPQRPGRALWGPRPCARYSGFRTRLGGAGRLIPSATAGCLMVRVALRWPALGTKSGVALRPHRQAHPTNRPQLR